MERKDGPPAHLFFSLIGMSLLVFSIGTGRLVGPNSAYAQSSTTTLSGAVVDENGAVVSDVTITIVSIDRGLRKQTTTNAEGYFAISMLPLGRYTVTAQHQGFSEVEIRDVVLNVNNRRSLRIQLKVGQVSESVSIEGASLIQTESADVSTLIDRKFVENLPLNGRSFNTLIELTPGTVLTKPSSGGQFSVNGQRANANYFTVDGVGANVGISASGFSLDVTAGGTAPAYNPLGGTSTLVSIDALQEFRIQTSSYAAEFGHTPGAQVSVVSRSGTNQFHGTLFDYFRNDALDANDWFANSRALKKPPLRQNDFGGVLGGPIVTNRTFFFFSYEGLRLRQPQVAITEVPTLSARQSASPLTKPLLDAFPLPTGRDLGDGFAEASATYSNPTSMNATSIRMDHMVSNKLTLFGRYSYAPSETQERIVTSGTLNNVSASSFNLQTLTLGITHTLTSTVSNDLRVNYSRNRAGGSYSMDNFGGAIPPPDSVVFLPPLATRQNTVSLIGIGPVNYLVGGENGINFQRQLNLVDNLLLVSGTHELRFGVDYRRLSPKLGNDSYGINIIFDDVAGAVAAMPSFVATAATSVRSVLLKNFAAYGQDSWKATKRLTLNYGLRWEVNPPPASRDGNDPYTVIGLNDPTTMTLAPKGTPLWKTTYGNFAPRVGAAYQLSQEQGRETVLRGGFGVFYDLGTGPVGEIISRNSFPYLRITTLPNTLPIDPAIAAPPASLNPPYISFSIADPNLKLPRTYEWNFAVERSLGIHQTVSATYVAAQGRRLLRREILRGPSLSNPNFQRLVVFRNTATSDYQALQLQFQRRLTRGWQALAYYSWSHSIDIASAESSRTVSDRRIDPKTDRGSSNFDVRHSFTAAVTYDIPKLAINRVGGNVLRNWSIDSILRLRTATPVDLIANTPALFGVFGVTRPDLIAGVPLYLNDSTVAGGRRINSAAFATPAPGRQGTLGRNVLRAFPVSQLDLALRRKFDLGGRYSLQVRSDFFNIFNHPNFGDPTNFLGDPLFGQSLQMLGRDLGGGDGGFSPLYQIGGPRSIQVALKLQF